MNLSYLNKFLTLENINNYPYNLNSKLKDNIILTKKEIELEYKKNYMIFKNNNNIKGSNHNYNIVIII